MIPFSFFRLLGTQFLTEIPPNNLCTISESSSFCRFRSFNMWSFAIYLVSFLQAAFAKPVDWLDVSAAPNPVIPGRVEGIGNFGDIALDGGWETKAPSSDSNPTSEAPRMSRWRTLVSTELALSPEYVDSGVETTSNAESLAPYSVDILAELTPGDDVSRRPKLDWDSNPYFRVGSVIEMDKRHHLHYPDYDQGFTRFLCEAENLACCEIYESLELRFSKDEQPPYYVLCEKCTCLTSRRFLAGC